jgi:shikimate kinase
VGLEALRRCCATTSLPVVAIGGLDPDRARLVLEAGAAAVAVASALALGDLEANARAFRDACGDGPDPHWVLTGLPGSGKTTVGRELARRSGRPFVDLDDLVEAATGLSVSEVFAQRGEAVFREEERRALERQLGEVGPPAVVALGGGALNVAGCREALDRAGARVAWLDLPPEACAHRLARSSVERPLLAHAKGPELAAELERLLSLRWSAYAGASLKVDAAAGAGPVAEELLRAWST